jgi:hypothetical protein
MPLQKVVSGAVLFSCKKQVITDFPQFVPAGLKIDTTVKVFIDLSSL